VYILKEGKLAKEVKEKSEIADTQGWKNISILLLSEGVYFGPEFQRIGEPSLIRIFPQKERLDWKF
jgi:hypothetical protein